MAPVPPLPSALGDVQLPILLLCLAEDGRWGPPSQTGHIDLTRGQYPLTTTVRAEAPGEGTKRTAGRKRG